MRPWKRSQDSITGKRCLKWETVCLPLKQAFAEQDWRPLRSSVLFHNWLQEPPKLTLATHSRGVLFFTAGELVQWWDGWKRNDDPREGVSRRAHSQIPGKAMRWIGPVDSGRVNQKVEPRPGALSTPTCPWCCSMMALAMANPRPIPLSGPRWLGEAT